MEGKYTKEEWDKAIGFLMNAFNAPEFESADDEIDRSWRSIAYEMMEYRSKLQSVEKIYIEKPDRLDPITIYLDGGRLTVVCYDACWATYFGSFDGTLREFLTGVDVGYLKNRLIATSAGFRTKRPSKIEDEYIHRIATAVLTYLKTI